MATVVLLSNDIVCFRKLDAVLVIRIVDIFTAITGNVTLLRAVHLI